MQKAGADDEGPHAAVPEAQQEPHDEKPDAQRQLLSLLFAEELFPELSKALEGLSPKQGIHEIVPEPVAQGNVPAPPELRIGAREKGLFEIFRKPDAKELSGSQHHIHAAGKIRIKLQAVADSRKDQIASVIDLQIPVDPIDEYRQPLRKHQLFKEAPQEPGQAVQQVFRLEAPPFRKGPCKLSVAVDGALYNVQEQG